MYKRKDAGEDYRWNTDRLVNADDFNRLNSVAIFAGPLLNMYRSITKEELKTLLDFGADIVVLDVLDKESYEKEHILGSINIPVSSIERDAPAVFKPDDLIIVYGRDARCTMSAVAADKLTTIGLKNVLRYNGGIEEWREEGLPVEGKEAPLTKAA